MSLSPTPHDALFRSLWSILEYAESHLRDVLPKPLVARIDWPTLTLKQGSFVGESLAYRHADMLYEVSILGTGVAERAYVYVLYEHLSTVDPWAVLRLLEYVTRIWRAHVDNEQPGQSKGTLPVIIPVVVHHSENGWSASKSFAELFALPASSPESAYLLQFVPQFQVIFDDVSKTSDDDLRARAVHNALRLAFFFMQTARDEKALFTRLKHWAGVFAQLVQAPSGHVALLRLLQYFMQVTEFDIKTTREIFAPILGEGEKGVLMTLAEQLKQEGEKRGTIAATRRSVLRVLAKRGIAVTDAQRDTINACTNLETLEKWHDEAIVCASSESLLALP